MTINHDWRFQVSLVEEQGFKDVVKSVKWTLTSTDLPSGVIAARSGEQVFDTEGLKKSSYLPTGKLNSSILSQWVIDSLGYDPREQTVAELDERVKPASSRVLEIGEDGPIETATE